MSREQTRRDADSDLQAWQTCQRRLDECRKRAEQAERRIAELETALDNCRDSLNG